MHPTLFVLVFLPLLTYKWQLKIYIYTYINIILYEYGRQAHELTDTWIKFYITPYIVPGVQSSLQVITTYIFYPTSISCFTKMKNSEISMDSSAHSTIENAFPSPFSIYFITAISAFKSVGLKFILRCWFWKNFKQIYM